MPPYERRRPWTYIFFYPIIRPQPLLLTVPHPRPATMYNSSTFTLRSLPIFIRPPFVRPYPSLTVGLSFPSYLRFIP